MFDETLEIECPHCGHEMPRPKEEDDSEILCPKCSDVLLVRKDGMIKYQRWIEKSPYMIATRQPTRHKNTEREES